MNGCELTTSPTRREQVALGELVELAQRPLADVAAREQAEQVADGLDPDRRQRLGVHRVLGLVVTTAETGESQLTLAMATPPPAGGGSGPGRPRRRRRRRRGARWVTQRSQWRGQVGPAVGARDQRHQLATAAEQPRRAPPPRPRAGPGRRPRSRPAPRRARHRSRHGPAVVIASRAATVTAPWRAPRAAAVICTTSRVERATGLVHGERGDALHLGPGRDHDDVDAQLLGRAGGGLGGAERVGVVGQHDHLARRRWPRSRPGSRRCSGRRPGPPWITCGAGLGEQLDQPRSGGHDHQRPAGTPLPRPLLPRAAPPARRSG